jgi:hypothetical protein
MTMKNIATKALAIAALFAASFSAFGQATTSSTTLSAAIDNRQQSFVVASATGITVPSFAVPNNPTGGNQTILVVDQEAMFVTGVNGTFITVIRGYAGTLGMPHANGATVWLGPPTYFPAGDFQPKAGGCTSTAELNLPKINLATGLQLNCVGGVWVAQNTPLPYNLTDGEYIVPPGNCWDTESAHAGTLVHIGMVGGIPAIQAAITSSGSSDSVIISCLINPPFRTTSGKGIQITSVQLVYGVQTTNLPAPTGTLASGTINSQLVFTKFVAPAAGATETASSATLVRGDSGTLAVTPSLANFNVIAVTAGQFYTQTFTPAAAITVSDLTPLYFNLKLLVTDSNAIQINSPGIVVKYTSIPL